MEPVKAAWLTYGTGRLGPRGLTVVPTDTTKNVPDLMSQIQPTPSVCHKNSVHVLAQL